MIHHGSRRKQSCILGCAAPRGAFLHSNKEVIVCVFVLVCSHSEPQHRLIPAETLSKLPLSHPQDKLFNACLCLTWGCWAGALTHAFVQVQFHTTPVLTHCWTEVNGPILPRLSTDNHFQWVPCAGTTGLYTSSLSNLSTRSAAGPGDATMAGVTEDTGWEHMAGGLTEAHNQGQGRLVLACASPASSSLAFPSCWCQCSWSYAVSQMGNLIQLKLTWP